MAAATTAAAGEPSETVGGTSTAAATAGAVSAGAAVAGAGQGGELEAGYSDDDGGGGDDKGDSDSDDSRAGGGDEDEEKAARLRRAAVELSSPAVIRTVAEKLQGYRLPPDRVEELRETLKGFLGTKNYHNYTNHKKASDPSCKRYSMSVVSPFVRATIGAAALVGSFLLRRKVFRVFPLSVVWCLRWSCPRA